MCSNADTSQTMKSQVQDQVKENGEAEECGYEEDMLTIKKEGNEEPENGATENGDSGSSSDFYNSSLKMDTNSADNPNIRTDHNSSIQIENTFSLSSQMDSFLHMHHLARVELDEQDGQFPIKQEEQGRDVVAVDVTGRSHNLKTFPCKECGKCFTMKRSLEVHLKGAHMGPDSHMCEKCGKSFTKMYMLTTHMEAAHLMPNKSPEMYPEDDKSNLQVDLSIPSDPEHPNKCGDCGRTYSARHYLQIHQKTAHQGMKLNQCPECGKHFTTKTYLKTHIEAAHRRSFVCNLCGRTYCTGEYLQTHIQAVHQEINPFTCIHCGRSYCNRTYLNIHIRSFHEGLGDHECKECGTPFHSSHELKAHMKSVHDGLKVHKCRECGKVFASLSYLKSHVQGTHQKLNACDQCGKTYVTKRYLEAHISSAH